MRSGSVCIAALCLVVAGCGGSNDDSAENTPTPEPMVVAADTTKGGEFWDSLSTDRQTELAGLCKNQVANDVDEKFGPLAYGQIADVDDSELAAEITRRYEQADNRGPSIAITCADVAMTLIRRVVLKLSGSQGAKTKLATAQRSGRVFPSDSTVKFRAGAGQGGQGWLPARRVKASPDTGKFTIRLKLHRPVTGRWCRMWRRCGFSSGGARTG